MKFLWVTINVLNLEETISFYSDVLGLNILSRFKAGPETEIAFMGNGIENETQVEFIESKKSPVSNASESVSIGFSVESVDMMLNLLKSKNIPITNGPLEVSGIKFFFIKDPNGQRVQIVEKVAKV